MLPASVKPGTLLAFDDAGAYCQSMASCFLGQPDPAEVFVSKRLVGDKAPVASACTSSRRESGCDRCDDQLDAESLRGSHAM